MLPDGLNGTFTDGWLTPLAKNLVERAFPETGYATTKMAKLLLPDAVKHPIPALCDTTLWTQIERSLRDTLRETLSIQIGYRFRKATNFPTEKQDLGDIVLDIVHDAVEDHRRELGKQTLWRDQVAESVMRLLREPRPESGFLLPLARVATALVFHSERR